MKLPENMFNPEIFKIIFSRPHKGCKFERMEILRNGGRYQSSAYTATQVFHENFDMATVREFICGQLENFAQYTAWDEVFEYSARLTKKGKLLTQRRQNKTVKPESFTGDGFNRQKNHIIREGDNIPVLADMGVFTREMKVAAPMWDKFHQINRFLELIADETNNLSPGTAVNIIDFGCGKSYLTFLVYHYFVEMRKLNPRICGLDLNPEIIQKCTEAAEKYGCSGLEFRVGDIGRLEHPPIEGWGGAPAFNIVISLHACDTATDYALYNAIRWNADLICAVPCCQHELHGQMQPQALKLFAQYGIIKERIAALATDVIRAKLLEYCGYRTQIIEFTPMEHTPKNLFIRGRRVGAEAAPSGEKMLAEIRKITHEFSFRPTLMTLLEQTL